jgi:hypothetical protein
MRAYERDGMKWNGKITRLKGQDNFRQSPSMTAHERQTRMINLTHEQQMRMRNLAHAWSIQKLPNFVHFSWHGQK